MKVLLIAPASGNWRHVGRPGLFNGRTFRFSLLSLLSVAAADLRAGHDWVTREFDGPWRIARRLVRMAAAPGCMRALPWAAAINGAYYGRVRRWGIRGWDPAREVLPARLAAPLLPLERLGSRP
jgi:hypothetical protein